MDDSEYTYVKREINKFLGVDLNAYKAQQMQRRLRTFLLRSGHSDWHSFFGAMRNDKAGLEKLKDYLTINVSSFFRDTAKYDQLQQHVIPELMNGRTTLRVWSAGCSRGQEPYTLAMVLADLTGPFRRHSILASDLDRTALDQARAGGPYTAEDVAAVPRHLLSRYFRTEEEGYRVTEPLRKKVTFRQHNLLTDAFETDLDLIVCRNVVIYFMAEVKEKLYKRFHDALRPGGVLFVGGTEIIPQAPEKGFGSMGISFYTRKEA
jgi:chemotaxis protein methyltransferase CheR